MTRENLYIIYRLGKAWLYSLSFYICRIFPIKKKKIVFTGIEGTTGYSCNPKYIAEEMIRRSNGYELVWLVDDIKKDFPSEVAKIHNTLLNRAYHLSTAKIWIDNSRKQLEVRKRDGQIYIQTWHAKLGFKPTCLDRGKSFSRIAYLVSQHDSEMIDYVLSNSDWYDATLPTGMMYRGKILRTGSPRCDILINGKERARKQIRKAYGLADDVKILIYAPTFRGGSQGGRRQLANEDHAPDFTDLRQALREKFGGNWMIMLRLHPQMTVRHIGCDLGREDIIDVSCVDDMYEILAGCDAYMTDYSSAAFDAMVMKIPVFIYADDAPRYVAERGRLLWDWDELPFLAAFDNKQLIAQIARFDNNAYLSAVAAFMRRTGMVEDGQASRRVCDFIEKM